MKTAQDTPRLRTNLKNSTWQSVNEGSAQMYVCLRWDTILPELAMRKFWTERECEA